ncbi:MAG: aromatic ring-hydroxylating dioxygenase subunit alpha [Alphaproteobacteria bacterium]
MNAVTQTKFVGDTGALQHLVPICDVISPENFEREREKIFRRAWLPLMHAYDLPERGSYQVIELPMFRTSVLVVRGQDDTIRCFHNLCRHRGNKLVRAGSGCKSGFACGFHGWTYSNTGILTGVTDEQQFQNLDRTQYGLMPITSDTWEGYVFVNFDTQPRQTLHQWMGVMADQFRGYFDGRERIASHRMVANCNYHLAVNAFTEGYHTLYLHRNTVPDYQGGSNNPLRHRPHLELLERHTRYSAPANPEHKRTPVEALAYDLGYKLFPDFKVDTSHLPAGVNPSKVDQWAFDVCELFPNFVMLNGANWHMDIFYWPIDARRTTVKIDIYAKRATTHGERLAQAYFRARGREVFREDINTLEATQTMLESGAIPHMVLSRQEMALQHHFKVAAKMMAA